MSIKVSLEHRDSSGSHGTIGPGDVQWMTAASGVVHEEFHSERFAREGGTLEMVQLWVNLPAKDKISPPRYQGWLDADIPRVSLTSGTMRVIAGKFQGIRGAAKTFTPVNVWDLQLEQSQQTDLKLAEDHTSLIIVQSGNVRINGTAVGAVEVAELGRCGAAVRLESQMPSRLLVLTGEPIAELIVGRGPFVMNLHEEIIEAIGDYQTGRMESVPV